MTSNSKKGKRYDLLGENILTAISVGALLILIGSIYVTNLPTSLFDELTDFFGSFTTSQVSGTGLDLPVPAVPGAHAVLYNAVFQFCIGLSLLQVVLLLLRLVFRSRPGKTSETTGNLVFWLGASFLVPTFLNTSSTADSWFSFWAALLMVIGLSMIARAVVLYLKKRM